MKYVILTDDKRERTQLIEITETPKNRIKYYYYHWCGSSYPGEVSEGVLIHLEDGIDGLIWYESLDTFNKIRIK